MLVSDEEAKKEVSVREQWKRGRERVNGRTGRVGRKTMASSEDLLLDLTPPSKKSLQQNSGHSSFLDEPSAG